jgi:hypothetical protein
MYDSGKWAEGNKGATMPTRNGGMKRKQGNNCHHFSDESTATNQTAEIRQVDTMDEIS